MRYFELKKMSWHATVVYELNDVIHDWEFVTSREGKKQTQTLWMKIEMGRKNVPLEMKLKIDLVIIRILHKMVFFLGWKNEEESKVQFGFFLLSKCWVCVCVASDEN